MIMNVNIAAVLAATVLQIILGMIWYSPAVFGKQWMALTGMTDEKAKKGMQRAMLIGVSASFITACILAWLLNAMSVGSVKEAVKLAVILWGGLLLASEMHGVAWEQRPVQLMWINAGWSLAALALSAAAIQGWSF